MELELVKVAGEYISFGNSGVYKRDALEYYIETKPTKYTYRGVDVYVKETFNKDYSHRGYVITKLSIDTYGDKINYDDVRSYIDNRYKSLTNKILSSDSTPCEYKMLSGENCLYETAIKCLISKKYSIAEKRFIANDLLFKGMKLSEMINFYKYL